MTVREILFVSGFGVLAGVGIVLIGCGDGYSNQTFSQIGSSIKPGGSRSYPMNYVAPANANHVAMGRVSPNPESQQQEQYSHFNDNAYLWAAAEPVSTFSTDVNTASYSNLRRFLNEGKLPPKDAVRVAELVNYFPYSYPTPAGDDPVSLTADIAPCPWQPKHHLARIGVRAKTLDPSAMPPRNLVFLIDVSGSMSEQNKLPLVKKSLNLLIDQMTAKDTVSVVTYAGDTAVKLRPTGGDNKPRIRSVVNALNAGGGTNGGSGIQLAYEQARANFLGGGVNRVILCTDGDFNIGTTSEGELVRLIERERKGNVFLTVLGFGMGNLKDSTLEKLANHGNGHYAYIDSESEAYKVFVQQGAALATVAKDVKLQVHFNPAQVSAYRLIGYENRLLKNEDFKNDAKDAGDMGSGHTVTAFYEVVPVGVELDAPKPDKPLYGPSGKPVAADKTGDWLTVKMRYKHPEDEKSLELSQPLPAKMFGRPVSADFRFAAAVTEFGMLLRDSQFKGQADIDRVLKSASENLDNDPGGHRAEFTGMVRQARKLMPKAVGGEGGRE